MPDALGCTYRGSNLHVRIPVYKAPNEVMEGSNHHTCIALAQVHLIVRITPPKFTIIPAATPGDGPRPPQGRPLGLSPQASQDA